MKQVGERRNKLSTLVRFPLTGLDMAPHVVKRSQSMKNLNSGAWPQSWKQPSGKDHQSAEAVLPNDYLYDLYAVCNHHGGMHGGHYTGNKQDYVIKFFFIKNSYSLYWNFCSVFYVHVPLALLPRIEKNPCFA